VASTQALGPAITAVLAMLRASIALTTHVGVRVYPDDKGMVGGRTAMPYVQVETGNELPFNTMGPPSTSKWGSEVRLQVRVVCQGLSEAQPNAISSVVKQALDGQPIAVSGYGSACIEYQGLQPITAVKDGCAGTREWVNEYLVTVHQL
jgi:hypothetical protein